MERSCAVSHFTLLWLRHDHDSLIAVLWSDVTANRLVSRLLLQYWMASKLFVGEKEVLWKHYSLMYSIGHRVSFSSVRFSSLSHVQLFVTPWTAAHRASLSITNSQSLLKLMYIESVMPSNHLILCRPLLFLPSIFPSIRVSLAINKNIYFEYLLNTFLCRKHYCIK